MIVPRRICVVTSYMAAMEPRAPRHAIAAKRAFPNADVVLVDLRPKGVGASEEPELLRTHDIKRRTVEFPSRASGVAQLAARKLATRFGRAAFAGFGIVHASAFGDRAQGLARALTDIPSDVYIAHNIDTLLPAMRAAERHEAAVVFDCMEYYSDMGDGQDRIGAAAARALETKYLRRCALVIASSDTMADALRAEYGISRPLAAYNVPPTEQELPPRQGGGLNLYWRNSTIGFGQRGLEDIIEALVALPADVHLYLQGRYTPVFASQLAARIEGLGLRDRVHVLAPYAPHEAVRMAAAYDIGLCLERKGPRNHDLTVSNKMFDYHMAKLAVIATDLPGLADVIRRSGGGILCQPGDPASLADAIRSFLVSPQLLSELQNNARRFALATGNIESEIERISGALKEAMARPGAAT